MSDYALLRFDEGLRAAEALVDPAAFFEHMKTVWADIRPALYPSWCIEEVVPSGPPHAVVYKYTIRVLVVTISDVDRGVSNLSLRASSDAAPPQDDGLTFTAMAGTKAAAKKLCCLQLRLRWPNFVGRLRGMLSRQPPAAQQLKKPLPLDFFHFAGDSLDCAVIQVIPLPPGMLPWQPCDPFACCKCGAVNDEAGFAFASQLSVYSGICRACGDDVSKHSADFLIRVTDVRGSISFMPVYGTPVELKKARRAPTSEPRANPGRKGPKKGRKPRKEHAGKKHSARHPKRKPSAAVKAVVRRDIRKVVPKLRGAVREYGSGKRILAAAMLAQMNPSAGGGFRAPMGSGITPTAVAQTFNRAAAQLYDWVTSPAGQLLPPGDNLWFLFASPMRAMISYVPNITATTSCVYYALFGGGATPDASFTVPLTAQATVNCSLPISYLSFESGYAIHGDYLAVGRMAGNDHCFFHAGPGWTLAAACNSGDLDGTVSYILYQFDQGRVVQVTSDPFTGTAPSLTMSFSGWPRFGEYAIAVVAASTVSATLVFSGFTLTFNGDSKATSAWSQRMAPQIEGVLNTSTNCRLTGNSLLLTANAAVLNNNGTFMGRQAPAATRWYDYSAVEQGSISAGLSTLGIGLLGSQTDSYVMQATKGAYCWLKILPEEDWTPSIASDANVIQSLTYQLDSTWDFYILGYQSVSPANITPNSFLETHSTGIEYATNDQTREVIEPWGEPDDYLNVTSHLRRVRPEHQLMENPSHLFDIAKSIMDAVGRGGKAIGGPVGGFLQSASTGFNNHSGAIQGGLDLAERVAKLFL